MLKLFLDDERFPPDGPNWWTVRDMNEATIFMIQNGCPPFMSFDHDLGMIGETVKPTGLDVAWWMINRDMDMDGKFIPADFDFYVHSQNPVGAQNINLLLQGYLARR